MYNHKHLRRRFTLIELLVVIAIIAILASMLLPAVSRARETSRTSVCLGIEKQLVSITIQYMDDYQDFPKPMSAWYSGITDARAPNGGWGVGIYDRDFAVFSLRSKDTGITFYGTNYTGIFCPTSKKSQSQSGYGISYSMSGWGNGNASFSGQASNQYLANPMNPRYPYRAAVFGEVWHSGCSATIDTPTAPMYWNHGVGAEPVPATTNDGASGWSAIWTTAQLSLFFYGSQNLPFLDGHAEPVPIKQSLARHWPYYAIFDWDYRMPGHSPDL